MSGDLSSMSNTHQSTAAWHLPHGCWGVLFMVLLVAAMLNAQDAFEQNSKGNALACEWLDELAELVSQPLPAAQCTLQAQQEEPLVIHW
jgi:hypothetical protein